MPDSLKDTGDVEITPEMIEAGVSELSYDERFEFCEDVVRRIFHAMATTGGIAVRDG